MPINLLVPVAVGAVAIVLVMGLVNMMRGAAPTRRRSSCAGAWGCNSSRLS